MAQANLGLQALSVIVEDVGLRPDFQQKLLDVVNAAKDGQVTETQYRALINSLGLQTVQDMGDLEPQAERRLSRFSRPDHRQRRGRADGGRFAGLHDWRQAGAAGTFVFATDATGGRAGDQTAPAPEKTETVSRVPQLR